MCSNVSRVDSPSSLMPDTSCHCALERGDSDKINPKQFQELCQEMEAKNPNVEDLLEHIPLQSKLHLGNKAQWHLQKKSVNKDS